jgi:hypothetical protein
MFAGRLTQATLRALDWLAARTLSPEDIPAHQRTGRRGEEDAYFYLRQRGYTIIARNFRPRIIAANSISSAGIGTSCVLSR